MGFILEAAGNPGYEKHRTQVDKAFQHLEKM
jgi:hypothetical protein